MCKLMQTIGRKYDDYCTRKKKRDMLYVRRMSNHFHDPYIFVQGLFRENTRDIGQYGVQQSDAIYAQRFDRYATECVAGSTRD